MPSYVSGGAEAVGFFLAEKFIAEGLSVHLVVARGHGGLKDRSLPGGQKIDLNALTEILALPQWLGYLKKHNPRCAMTIVHTANLTGGLGAKFRSDIPVIATFHNSIVRAPKDQWWFRKYFGFSPERQLYKRMERMIAVSKGLADEVAQSFDWPRERVQHIANAPLRPMSETTPIDPEHAHIFNQKVVLGVGRLAHQKDFTTLIDAFKASDAQDANLLILGDGPLRSSLESQVKTLGLDGRVFMPGFVENPIRYMQRADVFALPSRFEGFSLVCVEAMASGVNIVATDCKHGPREILKDGAFGRLVPVADANTLGLAIAEALRDGSDHVSRRAERASHLARYAPSAMARSVYASCAGCT